MGKGLAEALAGAVAGAARRLRGERGNVAVITAGGLVALMGFTALSADVGRGYLARQRLQDVADAAALAGAQELPDQGRAELAAREVATRNGVDATLVRVSFPDSYTVRVDVEDSVRFFFAPVVSAALRTVEVRAHAVAGAGGVRAVGPRRASDGGGGGGGGNGSGSDDQDRDGTPDMCDADADGDGQPDDVERYHEIDRDRDGVPDYRQRDDVDGDGVPDSQERDTDRDGVPDTVDSDLDNDGVPNGCDRDRDADGVPDDAQDGWREVRSGLVPLGVEWADFTLGQLVALKVGPGNATGGNFHALQLGEAPGASRYRENLMYGHDGVLQVGDRIPTEPGNMSGPTRDGVAYRIALDPNTTFEAVSSGDVRPGSPRVVFVPVVGSFENVHGRKTVQVLGFAAFFLEGADPDGTVYGRFLRWRIEGEPGGPDYGLSGVRLTE